MISWESCLKSTLCTAIWACEKQDKHYRSHNLVALIHRPEAPSGKILVACQELEPTQRILSLYPPLIKIYSFKRASFHTWSGGSILYWVIKFPPVKKGWFWMLTTPSRVYWARNGYSACYLTYIRLWWRSEVGMQKCPTHRALRAITPLQNPQFLLTI